MLTHVNTMAHNLASEDVGWHKVDDGNTYWMDFGKPGPDFHTQFVINTAEIARAVAASALVLAAEMEADPNAK